MRVPRLSPANPRLRHLAAHLRPSRAAAVVLLLAHGVGVVLRLSLLGHLALTVGLEAALLMSHLRPGRLIAGRRAKASRTAGPTP
jgi:hypothetical protein